MARKSKRIYRDLTPAEEARVAATRRTIESEKDELLAQARQYRKLDEARRPKPKKGTGPAALGERLRQLRIERRLSQQAVAEAAAAALARRKMSTTARSLQSTLSQIETGVVVNPGVLTLDAICRAIGTSIPEVLGT